MMFNLFKKKERLPRKLCKTVKKRAIYIMYDDNNEVYIGEKSFFIFDFITGNHAIDTYKTTLKDVIQFADKYGCTVDYLLGRTDTPYYTL